MSLEPDVVSDILSRLPIKSLVRFQGVSKSWCSLIKDPHFIRKHFNQSTSSDRNGGILIKYCCPTARKYGISFLFHDSFSPLSRYEVPPQIDIRHLKVVGSCNGLLCVANDSNVNSALPIYLWNPALREFRLLPNSLFGIAKLRGERISGVAHGFGYHPDADDYKLVRMVYLYCSDRPCFQAEVYTLRTDSWREISATNYLIKETSCVVYNDRLHWIAYEGGVKNREMIVSFDMGDEMFLESVLPDFHSAEIRVCMRLTVFKHSLCLINYYGGRAKSFDLWVMNNDGTGLFWTRKFSVGPLFGVERPLGCARNGEVFLEKRCGRMIVYNPRTEEIVNLPILGLMYTCELHLHQESLVSVYGRNGTLEGAN
ncbi:hypothetical protein CJ030_MR7G001537 [Morella rubra]|uniref:F-box domain-containing protein n=1 Tax=Morella rubra TaxID=262757 RepID=A0A6A1V1T6_9ROSI|nr:hypothetical protein CJ030_MR7G001537 [Morella rubra]